VADAAPTPASTPTLHADVVGAGPRLVLVHGFTQTRRCWGPVADDLARDHELVLVDAPGHGRSAHVDADLVEGGRLVAEVGGPAVYVGYSMGGRIVLHTALERPDVVRGLVLVGATAGLESAAERAARVADDEARARRLEQVGVAAFLDEWLALPLFAGLSPAAAARAERLENTAAGLASSLRRAGTGTQWPTWDRLGGIDAPTLVVAGADDAKFVALGRRLADGIGAHATFDTVPDAGHTAHLEQPGAFLARLRPWLATLP
jgi:2-succinyl-6-hydroxy-2,4-cyclohexadiene-1-carboxylate synthase